MSNFGDRITGWLPWLLAIVILAGIVHIVSVLAMPRLAEQDSWQRLGRVAPLHKLTPVQPRTQERTLLPYEDPATELAVCRFDLARGVTRLRANLSGDGLVLLSFRSRFGTAFYSLNDRGTSRGRLDVVIGTGAQIENIQSRDPEDEIPSELRLVSPTDQGFVLIRVFVPEPGLRAEATKRLGAINCQLEKLDE